MAMAIMCVSVYPVNYIKDANVIEFLSHQAWGRLSQPAFEAVTNW